MSMSEEHKAALARGRKQSRAIKAYLIALDSRKLGRPMTKENLALRLKSVNEKLDGEDNPLKRVEILQNKLDIEQELSEFEHAVHSTNLKRASLKMPGASRNAKASAMQLGATSAYQPSP